VQAFLHLLITDGVTRLPAIWLSNHQICAALALLRLRVLRWLPWPPTTWLD
jgi:hypothetical protein